MSGSTTKAKKKKRAQDEQVKRMKSTSGSSGSTSTKPMLFENTLSLPIQQALFKFREASEQELIRLKKEGLEPSAAINKLVEKMRTIESDVTPCFSRQELDLVMEMAGINEEGAIRALILRSELAKLRHDGFNHPEAINELARRMKRLAGSKRRVSLSMADGTLIETKHRRTTVTPTTTLNLPRVSFTHDAGLRSLDPPSLTSITRKRLQDVLMMDDEGWGLRKRARFLEKDISESEEGSGDDHHHAQDDLGEFSQEERDGGEDGEGDDLRDDLFGVTSLEDIPLFSAFTADYPSSDEGLEGVEGEGEGEAEGDLPPDPLLDDFSSDPEDSWTTLHAAASELLPTLSSLSTLRSSASTPSFNLLSPPSSSSSSSSSSVPRTPALRVPRPTTKHRDSRPSSLSHRTIS